LHDAADRDSGTTFLLNLIESGDAAHVPLANVIVAEELLRTEPPTLKVLPTATLDGMV
jgi:hypothetical protein